MGKVKVAKVYRRCCTKLLDDAKKTHTVVPQLKYKFAPFPRLHLQSDYIINAHTKLYVWICPATTHLTSQTAMFAMLI